MRATGNHIAAFAAASLAVLFAIPSAPANAQSPWWNSSYQYRRKITFDNSSRGENLQDFPVLVRILAASFDYTKTVDFGEDIRFVDADGTTVLAHEIERWSEVGNSFIWVKVPQIDAWSGTDHIWLYYGKPGDSDGQNAAGVWTNGYVGVWHLATDENDSTSYGHDATNNGSTNLWGRIAQGQDFDGAAAYLEITSTAYLQPTTALTVSAWVRGGSAWSGTDSYAHTILRKGDNNPNNYNLCVDDDYIALMLDDSDGGGIKGTTVVPIDTWVHAAATWDGANVMVYYDGAPDIGAPVARGGSIGTDTRPLYIGGRSAGTDMFDGTIDEVRIANVSRSGTWIEAQYASMRYNLLSIGSEETDPTTDPRVTSGLIVLYEFEETSGATIYDTSGSGTPMDLTIQNTGVVSHGADNLSVSGNTLITSTSSKVINACMATDEITIEAWVAPANTTQGGPARIVTQSLGGNDRDFSLMQDAADYDVRLRTTSTTVNGVPNLYTPGSLVTTSLTHVVYTRDSSGTEAIYVNGSSAITDSRGGDFSNWATFDFALCGEFNDLTSTRYWHGDLHLVAIYDRALSSGEVTQNYDAGADPNPTPTPPGAFTLASPANGATGVSLTATLDWTSASGATTYALLVDDDPGFASPEIDEPALASSSYTMVAGDVADSTTYYWRVTATNANGTTPASNNDFSFTTLVPPPPGAFWLNAPTNGSSGASLTATLDWGNAADATSYALQVDDDPLFGSPEIDLTSLAVSEYTILAGEVLGTTTYYWRVTAVNGSGTTPASNNDFSFTTGIPPAPMSFALLSPADGAADARVGVTLDWEDSTFATSYALEVDDDPLFGSPEIAESSIAASAYTAPAGALQPEITYYWYVTATNGSGTTPASNNDFSFTTILPMGYLGDGCVPRGTPLPSGAVAVLLLACIVAAGAFTKRSR